MFKKDNDSNLSDFESGNDSESDTDTGSESDSESDYDSNCLDSDNSCIDSDSESENEKECIIEDEDIIEEDDLKDSTVKRENNSIRSVNDSKLSTSEDKVEARIIKSSKSRSKSNGNNTNTTNTNNSNNSNNQQQIKDPIILKQSYEPMYIRSVSDDTPKKKDIIYPVFYELFLKIDDNFWKTVFINFAIGKFYHGFGYVFKKENKSNSNFNHMITFRKGKNIIKKVLSTGIEECILQIQIFVTNHTSMNIPKESLYFVPNKNKNEQKDNNSKNRQQNKKSKIAQYIQKIVETYNLSKEAEKDFRNSIAKYHLSGSIQSNRIVYDSSESIECIKGIEYNEEKKQMEIDIPFKKTKKVKDSDNPINNTISPTFQRDKSETSSTNLASKKWKKYLENISRNSKFIDKKVKINQPMSKSKNH